MIKNKKQLQERKQFVKLSVNDPKAAAAILRRKAKGLENCKTTIDVLEALKDILYLKGGTLENDLYRNDPKD